MNAGIGDYTNLAWKLSSVLLGRSPSSILDTYESERRVFAESLIKTTDTFFKMMAGYGWLGWDARNIFLGRIIPTLVNTFSSVRRFAFPKMSQIAVEYRTSDLSEGSVGHVQAGNRLPWVEVDDGSDNFECLQGFVWRLHLYGEIDEQVFTKELGERTSIPIHIFAKSKKAVEKGLDNVVCLVRPDGYIGFIGSLNENEREHTIIDLREYIAKWIQIGA